MFAEVSEMHHLEATVKAHIKLQLLITVML